MAEDHGIIGVLMDFIKAGLAAVIAVMLNRTAIR